MITLVMYALLASKLVAHDPHLATAEESRTASSSLSDDPQRDGFDPIGDIHGREAEWFQRCKPGSVVRGSFPGYETCGPCKREPAPIDQCAGEDGSHTAFVHHGDCVLGAAICVAYTAYGNANTYDYASKRQKQCGTKTLGGSWGVTMGGSATSGAQGGSQVQVNFGGTTITSTTCCSYTNRNQPESVPYRTCQ